MVMDEVSIEKENNDVSTEFPKSNSEILRDLPEYLNHLNNREQKHIMDTTLKYKDLLKDILGRTDLVEHDVDVGEAEPIKQGPYR